MFALFFLIKLCRKYIQDTVNYGIIFLMMTFIISISVTVIENYNKTMFGQRSGPKHCVVDLDDLSCAWLFLLQIKLA